MESCELLTEDIQAYWQPRKVVTAYFLCYMGEGLARAIAIFAPIFLMRQFGLTKLDVGFIILLAYLPWHFKYIIGLLMDSLPAFRGWRRRTYIFIAIIVDALAVLLLLRARDPWLEFLPALMLYMASDALTDTAVDALLIDVAPPEWHGFGLGSGWAARALGYVIATTLVVQLADLPSIGPLPNPFFGQNVFLLFALFPLLDIYALTIREPPVTKRRRPSKEAIVNTFTDPGIYYVVAFAFLGCFAYALDPLRGLFSTAARDVIKENPSIASIADEAARKAAIDHWIRIAVTAAGLSAAATSLILGRILDRIGHRRGYLISVLSSAIVFGLWYLLPPGSLTGLILLSALLGYATAFNFVAWEAVLADTTPPQMTAFTWAYFMSWIHVACFVAGTTFSIVLQNQGSNLAFPAVIPLIVLGIPAVVLARTFKTSKAERIL